LNQVDNQAGFKNSAQESMTSPRKKQMMCVGTLKMEYARHVTGKTKT
jgi:hypothetical protein